MSSILSTIWGNLGAFPFQLLWFTVWCMASLFRPILFLTCVCLATNPAAALRKFQLMIMTFQYWIFCQDKKWKKSHLKDPASFFPDNKDNSKMTRKTIVFVRHGESTWNDTFNKGDRSALNFVLHFLPNLCYALGMEWFFWVTGQANESWFFDSPLSEKGKRQGFSIQKFLKQDIQFLTPKEQRLIALLRGGGGGDKDGDASSSSSSSNTSQLVTSNLRRAIATMAIGFQDRLLSNHANTTTKKDPMLLLPCLQEISKNPDALSITPPHAKQVVRAWTDPKVLEPIYHDQMDTSQHTGNKAVSSNGYQRLVEFCNVVFDNNKLSDKDCIIAAGHSLWFRSFFQTFLPRNNTHVCKKKKLVNGGIVGLTLLRTEVQPQQFEYMIDPTSIVVLHGGF